MQGHLEKIDALLAELVSETAAVRAKLNVKEAAVANARKGVDTLDTHAVAMQKQMPRLYESCDALKDV